MRITILVTLLILSTCSSPSKEWRRVASEPLSECSGLLTRILEQDVPERVPLSYEEFLRFSRTSLISQEIELDDLIRELPLKKKQKLINIVETFLNRKTYHQYSVDDFTDQFFKVLYGRHPIMTDTESVSKGVHRHIQEDIMKRGLLGVLESQESYRNSGIVYRYKQFTRSKFGSYLATTLFNIPVLLGFPVPHLHNIGRIKLDPELAKKMINNGFEAHRSELENIWSSRIKFRNNYHILKEYYHIGVGAFFIGFLAYEMLTSEDLTLELSEEELENVPIELEHLRGILQSIDSFEAEDGQEEYQDIYSKTLSTSDSISCDSVQFCLESSSFYEDIQNSKKMEVFSLCENMFDSEDLCQRAMDDF